MFGKGILKDADIVERVGGTVGFHLEVERTETYHFQRRSMALGFRGSNKGINTWRSNSCKKKCQRGTRCEFHHLVGTLFV
jgi:hypothetical protein